MARLRESLVANQQQNEFQTFFFFSLVLKAESPFFPRIKKEQKSFKKRFCANLSRD